MSLLFRLAAPLFDHLDPESVHLAALRALELGWVGGSGDADAPELAVEAFGRSLPNPVGLAAGFDKNARMQHRLADLGFGFGECGGVTPRPQAGNPRPRMFRLTPDVAAINRMGFNNDGVAVVTARLAQRPAATPLSGVNLAANADSADPAGDFVALARAFAPLTGFLTLDISCPNTANGKMFLEPGPLRDLLGRLSALFAEPGAPPRPALLAKIAPDLSDNALADVIAELLVAGIDGMILTNTMGERPPGLRSPKASERGGLSGRPIFQASTEVLRAVRRQVGTRLTLIGVGGVEDGATAYAKIRAGATLIQLYTAIAYQGPGVVGRIKRELTDLLRRDGFVRVADAVGVDA